MNLNHRQQAAVDTDAGQVLVIAGPGTGKTRTLVSRVERLIREGWAPGSICCLTFTRLAAAEMRERLARALPDVPLSGMWIGTFHAWAHKLLEEHGAPAFRPGLTIVDQAERDAIIDDLIAANALGKKKALPQLIRYLIGGEWEGAQVKVGDAGDGQYAHRIFQQYRQRLRSTNSVDLSEMVPAVCELLRDRPSLATELRDRYAYMLVDEYQDTSANQQELVDRIGPRNLFVVGDVDQAIYGWRGANPRGILEFGERPGVERIVLDGNYRSWPSIVAAANRLIANNVERFDTAIRPERDGLIEPGDGFSLCPGASTQAHEARQVVEALQTSKACRDGSATWSDFAVLARTHAALEPIAQELARGEIPFFVVQKKAAEWETPAARWLIALLRLHVNPKDDASLRRLLRPPGESVPALASELDLATWEAVAHERGVPLYAAVRDDQSGHLAGVLLAKLDGFVDEEVDAIKPSDLASLMLCSMSLPLLVVSLVSNALPLLVAWEADEEAPTVRGLLRWYATRHMVDALREKPKDPAVTLCTIHAAKGLEWIGVYVVGMEEGLFPSSKATGERLEEERRLAYVAVTRGRDVVMMTRATARESWGKVRTTEPSRFLAELDECGRPIEGLPFADLAEADDLPF